MSLRVEQFMCRSDNFGVLLHDAERGRRDEQQEHQQPPGGAERVLADEQPERAAPPARPERRLGDGNVDGPDRHHAFPYRMRGSSQLYSRSTVRLASTTTTAISIARFCTIG